MADIESKLQQDITPARDSDPLLGPVASELARYLASIAMTAAATIMVCRCRQQGDHSQPISDICCSSSDHRGLKPRLGSVVLFGDTWRSGLQFFPYRASVLTGRRRCGEHLGDWTRCLLSVSS